MVTAALSNRLNPSIGRTRCLTRRCSFSMRLFKYWLDRTLTFWEIHFPHCAMRCRIGVQRDLRRLTRTLHRTADKSLCGVHIATAAQEEIDSPAYLVHSPIQVNPAAANLYICLVHPPGSADRTSVSA